MKKIFTIISLLMLLLPNITFATSFNDTLTMAYINDTALYSATDVFKMVEEKSCSFVRMVI